MGLIDRVEPVVRRLQETSLAMPPTNAFAAHRKGMGPMWGCGAVSSRDSTGIAFPRVKFGMPFYPPFPASTISPGSLRISPILVR